MNQRAAVVEDTEVGVVKFVLGRIAERSSVNVDGSHVVLAEVVPSPVEF